VELPINNRRDVYRTNEEKIKMGNNNNKGKTNQMAAGVSIGFTAGAIIGVIIGVLTRDIALWLSVGVGCGMAIGVGVGGLLEYGKK
jgi:uncharacterized membrane protein